MPGAAATGSTLSQPSIAPTREAVALFDVSSFSKFLVKGRDAETVLQHLPPTTSRCPWAARSTPVLNERGNYEIDLTIARLARDSS